MQHTKTSRRGDDGKILFDGDLEQIAALQEVIGYLLTGDTSQQKIFVVLGPKRSGKGTVGRVIRRLLGDKNIAAPTLTSMTTQFGMEPLVGKLIAVISDVRIADSELIAPVIPI